MDQPGIDSAGGGGDLDADLHYGFAKDSVWAVVLLVLNLLQGDFRRFVKLEFDLHHPVEASQNIAISLFQVLIVLCVNYRLVILIDQHHYPKARFLICRLYYSLKTAGNIC